MDVAFSCLTHLKATLVGRTGGQLGGRGRGRGGDTVRGQTAKVKHIRFSVPNPLS